MTRRLILIRHAKSSWADGHVDDHGRQLNDRGIKSAEAIGRWLAEQGYCPDVIATSDAMRTLQTTALLKTGMRKSPETVEVAALYHAAPQTMLEVLKGFDVPTVLVVGHNPGIAMLAEMLVEASPDHPRFEDYPTCATSVMEFDKANWCQPGRGRLTDFIVPREL